MCSLPTHCFHAQRTQKILRKILVFRLKICYHRGQESEDCMGSLAISPYNLRQALTSLEGIPTRH